MNNFKQFVFTLLLALALLAAVACSTADPAPVETAEPTAPPVSEDPTVAQPAPADNAAEEPTAPAAEDETAPPAADLPLLPRVAGGGEGGFGGGLAAADSAVTSEALPPAGTSMMMIDPFSGTVFTLDTTLPTAPTEALVWRQPERTLTAERAAEVAAKFGFTGPLYREAFSPDAAAVELEAARPMPTMPFFAFNDDDEQLVITASGAFYTNHAIEVDFPTQIDPAVAIPAAEAFLQQRGLLNFEYAAEEWYAGQVVFKRLINGEPSNQPEIYVTLNNDGQVQFVSYEVLNGLNELGRYPLIPAEQAWELLQTGRIFEHNIPFEFNSSPEEEFVVYEDPYADDYQFWPRTYQPGDTLELFSYPLAYLPVDESVAPLVRVNNYALSASNEELRAISEAIGQQFKFVGTLGADGQTLQLESWETFEFVEPLYLEGTIAAGENGAVLINTVEGETYQIPDAPADLEAGLDVFVFAWEIRETDGAYPAVNWENIEKRINPAAAEPLPEEPVVAEPLPVEPPVGEFAGYEGVNITEVTLGYYTTYQYETIGGDMIVADAVPVVIQPVWQFTGTISGGPAELETVTFYLQAVDPALLNEAPQG